MQMMAYVVASMTGVAYNFVTASILAVAVTVVILILGEIVPDKSAEGHH
jgi:CBS domain containing-hemolysin-like protein